MNTIYCNTSGDTFNLRSNIENILKPIYESLAREEINKDLARSKFLSELTKEVQNGNFSIPLLVNAFSIAQGRIICTKKINIRLFTSNEFEQAWINQLENPAPIEVQTEQVLRPEEVNRNLEDLEILDVRFMDVAYGTAVAARDAALRISKEEIMSAFVLNRMFLNGTDMILDDNARVAQLRAYQGRLFRFILNGLDGNVITIDQKFKGPLEYDLFITSMSEFYKTYNDAIQAHFTPATINTYYELSMQASSEAYKAQDILKGYRAYLVLMNFDSALSLVLGDSVGIKHYYRGVLLGKYSLNVSTLKLLAVNNAEEHDATKETSKFLKALIETTPYYSYDPIRKVYIKSPDKYLGYSDFACVAAQIKDLVYDADVSNIILSFTSEEGELKLAPEGEAFAGIEQGKDLNADLLAFLDYVLNYLPSLLNKSQISLLDVIDAHRVNPIKNFGVMILIMASDYFWNKIVGKDNSTNKYLNALTTPFRNAVLSVFRGITSLENKKSINAILQKYSKNNVNDYYAWIAQNADSVQNTKFLQYYINADNLISVRELYDQLVEQQKQKIKFAVNTLGRPKLFNNIDLLRNQYEIISDPTDTSEFRFKIELDSTSIYTIIVKNPKSEKSSITILDPKQQEVEYADILQLGSVLFPFINALTGQHFSYENPYFLHFCTLVSTEEALPMLLGLASRLYFARNLIDSSPAMQRFRRNADLYTKSLVLEYNDSTGLKLKIDPVLQDVDLFFNNKDVRTLFNLAEAKVIALGLSLSSQIKNGEGNGLGLVGLSRLVNSLPSLVKTLCLADDSAVGLMTLINTPGLYLGVYKMEEAKLEGTVTNHTDFTVAEFGTALFLLDFVGGLMPTNAIGDRSALGNGKVALLASVNSDKNFIGRLLLDLNTIYRGNIKSLKNKAFKDFTSEDLDNVIINDFGTVYNNIVEHINQDWKLLCHFIANSSRDTLSEPLKILLDYLNVINEDGSVSEIQIEYNRYEDFNKYMEGMLYTPMQVIKAAVKEYNKNKANNWKVAALALSDKIKEQLGTDVTEEELNIWAANTFLEATSEEAQALKLEAIEALRVVHNVLREANFSPVLAFYENFHYSNGSSNLTLNSTLLSLVNRFNSKDRTEYNEFFNTKNYESVKSALNNGFELVLPEAPKTIDETDPRHPAIQYLRNLLGKEWVAPDDLMIYAKVSIAKNGEEKEFNLTNRLSLQRLQTWLTEEIGNEVKAYDFYKDFTSLLKFFEQFSQYQGKLTINPMIDKWNKMDYLFTLEFMYASVGSHISHNAKETAPMKDLRKAYEDVLASKKEFTDPQVLKAYREYLFSVESARFFAQHKRNVAMTASKREFLLNYLMGIPNKYNIAIIKDVKDILGNFSGLVEDGVKPYDGGCYVNPIVVLLENYSLGAERAGINKKLFGHFYNQRMSAAGILKMAGFGITNETMRHSLMDRVMCKHMMEKKWNRRLDFDSNPFLDALLYKEHIYNLLVDYDGKRINYNNGEPLYYESLVSFRVPEDGNYSIVHKSRVPEGSEVISISRLNALEVTNPENGAVLQKDNLKDFVLIKDPSGKALTKGDILTESFYLERTFDNPDSAVFINEDQNLEVDGVTYALKEGQYIFKDRLLDVSKNNDGQLILNLNTKDPAPTSTPIYNVVITDVVDCNYKALTELFMGYRAVDTAATDTTLELLRSFEYTPLELVTPRVGAKYLQQSELSIAYLAEAACAVGDKRAGVNLVRTQDDVWQPLKYSDILYGVTEGAIKLFAANANENKAYTDYNYEWDYYEIYSRELGIQLDKEHHADSEEVSLMNQVVSALASRGFSTQKARNAYNAIASLTESGLRLFKGLEDYLDFVYVKDSENPNTLDIKKAKKAGAEEFIKCVKRTILANLKNATTRDGEFIRNIATEVTKQLIQNKDLSETPVTLAGSDNLLYNKVSSILASTFTNDAIKTKLLGILSVLSPSHQRMKTYAGSLLGHLDMASLIKKHELAQLVNLLDNLTTLRLNTTYTVKYDDGTEESWTPKTPHDIYEFKNNIVNKQPAGVYENILAGRDLGHYNAYFTIDVVGKDGTSSTKDCSLMDLDSVRWLSEWEHYFNEYYKALKDPKSTPEKIDGLKDESIKILSLINKNYVYYFGNIIPLLRNTLLENEPMPDTPETLLNKLIRNKESGVDDVVECALRRMLQSDLIALSPNTKEIYSQQDFAELYNTWAEAAKYQNHQILRDYAADKGINIGTDTSYVNDLYYLIYSKMRDAGCSLVSIDGQLYNIDKNTIRVKPYEVIMSKTLKSLLGLRTNECVQDLLNNPQVFAERLLAKYQSRVDERSYSLLLKRGDGNHINILHKNLLSANLELTNVPMVTVIEDGKMFRLGENREHLYQVQPQDILYVDSNGNEIIVTDNINFYMDNLSYITFVFSDAFINRDSDFKVVQTNMESSKSTRVKKWLNEGINWLESTNTDKKSEETDLNIIANTESFKKFNSILKGLSRQSNKDTWEGKYLTRLGNDMYSSFTKTLEHVAARIPALSMQSFMPMIIVDYCDADINVAYVSTSQIWLQGSDYDIDAVSLAGYSLNDSGLFVGWSPYFSLKSKNILQECCQFDFPTGESIQLQEIGNEAVKQDLERWHSLFKLIATGGSSVFKIKVYKDKLENQITKLLLKSPTDETVKNYVDTLNTLFRNAPKYNYTTDHFKDVGVKLLTKNGEIELTEDQLLSLYTQLKQIVDSHNTYISTAPADDVQAMSKNMLVNSMFSVTADPVNLIESLAPVDEVTKPYKKLANQAEEYKDLITFTPGNVWNKILAIHINQVGKDGISRCAVGMKAFFAATQAANYILEHGTAEQQARLRASRDTVNTWKAADIPISGLLANLRCKNSHTVTNSDVLEALLYVDNDHDAALVLSALMSLATDNAKELSLGNLNAGTKLIPLYIYGITQGIPFKELHKIITSLLGWTCARLFEGNFITGRRGLFDFNSVLNHLVIGPSTLVQDANVNINSKNPLNPLTFVSGLFISNLPSFFGKKTLTEVVGDLVAKELDSAKTPLTTSFSNLLGVFANMGWLANDTGTTITFEDKAKFLEKLRLLVEDSGEDLSVVAASLRFVNELQQYLRDVRTLYLNELGQEIIEVDKSSSYYGDMRKSTVLETLENLAIGAQELTQVGQVLSINNGLKSKLFELWLFIDNLENIINSTAVGHNSKNNRAWYRGNLRNSSHKPNLTKRQARLTINIHEFLTNEEYAEEKSNLLNKYLSSSYNLLDIIRNNDNFKSFIRAAVFDNAAVGAISAKFRSYNTLLLQAFDLMRATTSKDKLRVAKGVENLFDDFTFRLWLAKKDFKVKILDKQRYLTYDPRTLTIREEPSNGDQYIDLSTLDGLANFKLVMETLVLPSIISGADTYIKSGNFIYTSEIFQLMSPTITDRNPIHQSATAYTLDINMAPREDSERVILNHIRGEFNRLQALINDVVSYTNVLNQTATTIDIKDLLWLYNLVVFFGKNGEQTLNSLFDEYNVSEPLSKDYRLFLQDFDYGETSQDLIYGTNVTEAELKLYTGLVLDLWSSNLEYGFVRSRTDLKYLFKQKIKDVAYSSDELQEYDLVDESNAAFWARKARYANIPNVIPPDQYANYYIRGLVSPESESRLVHKTINIGSVPFIVDSYVTNNGRLRSSVYIRVLDGQSLGNIYSWVLTMFEKNQDLTLSNMLSTLFQIDALIDWTKLNPSATVQQLANRFANLPKTEQQKIKKALPSTEFNLFPTTESEKVIQALNDPENVINSISNSFKAYCSQNATLLQNMGKLIYADNYGFDKKIAAASKAILELVNESTPNGEALRKIITNTWNEVISDFNAWRRYHEHKDAIDFSVETDKLVSELVPTIVLELLIRNLILQHLQKSPEKEASQKLQGLLADLQKALNSNPKTTTAPITKIKTSTTQVITLYDSEGLSEAVKDTIIQKLKGCN